MKYAKKHRVKGKNKDVITRRVAKKIVDENWPTTTEKAQFPWGSPWEYFFSSRDRAERISGRLYVSDNSKFIVDPRDRTVLYSRDELHHDLLGIVSTEEFGGNLYYGYQFACKLHINDCLQFAEGLAMNNPEYSDKRSVYVEKNTGKVFGFTDKNNIKIATDPRAIQNEDANPEIGESYAIVTQELGHGDAPYHIAYVMFKDGDSNITLEANAGDPNLEIPQFEIYSGKREAFHNRYKDLFKPASTIVLQKRE